MAHISAAERRPQFIEAAIVVIARDGVDGATTRRIADEAKAPLATLHYCFQTKENLLVAVFEHLSSEMSVDLDSIAVKGASTATVAERVLTATMQWLVDRPVRARAEIEIDLWAQRNDPEMARGIYDGFRQAWTDLLMKGRTPLPAAEVETLVRVMIALADGLTMQFISDLDPQRTMRDTETACTMIRSYLKSRSRAAA
ncbi:TetR family transcriptional regulator [Nocardioides aromaticivorans]|uniref:TetR family transcriptional regulator n=1 Tax=Nocardioides aromaticivorans TaxID=200618 RepID=A0ABX7PGP4_9ACTN|nr:TetR family transcriptional regulator [Nocardioides aromaticivorans]